MKFKRILSVFLSALMVMTSVSAGFTAFAAEEESTGESTTLLESIIEALADSAGSDEAEAESEESTAAAAGAGQAGGVPRPF